MVVAWAVLLCSRSRWRWCVFISLPLFQKSFPSLLSVHSALVQLSKGSPAFIPSSVFFSPSFPISFPLFLPSHGSFLCFKTSLPFLVSKDPSLPFKTLPLLLHISPPCSFSVPWPLGPFLPFASFPFPSPLFKKTFPLFSFPTSSLVPLSRSFLKKNSPLLSFASAPWEQIMLRLVGHWARLSRFGSLDFGRARGG